MFGVGKQAHPEVEDLPGWVVPHYVAADGCHSWLVEGRPQLCSLPCAQNHILSVDAVMKKKAVRPIGSAGCRRILCQRNGHQWLLGLHVTALCLRAHRTEGAGAHFDSEHLPLTLLVLKASHQPVD